MEKKSEMTTDRIRSLIMAENPSARICDVEQYTHQMVSYLEAAESILRLGTITAHPRTAAPMENPYLKVRSSALAAMNKIRALRKLDKLWTAVREHLCRVTECP